MKKYLIYIVLLLIGIALGGFIFSGSDKDSEENSTNSQIRKSPHPHIKESANSHIQESSNSEKWTCSMHPQIMKTEPGDCPICGMDLVPAESDMQNLAINEITMTENAMALANIQTSVVGNANASENTLRLSGKIVQNEEKTAIQASYFDGRIEQLAINYEGQQVQRGQLLARIYSPELVAAQQELLTATAIKEEQPSLYKAVRNKLKTWKLTDAQIDAIEQSGKVRENFPIYATTSGTVTEVLSAAGDYVKRGAPLLKLSNLDEVWASFDAYENQITGLQEGQEIQVKFRAFPELTSQATISFIRPTFNNQTRTLEVRAVLPNEDQRLKPGMFVTGIINGTKNEEESAVFIPASAVLWTGTRSLVYVKTDQNRPVFEMREVQLGNRIGEQYKINAGLSQGEQIVTQGSFSVDAAAQLQGKKSMMNKSVDTLEKDMLMKLPEQFKNEFSNVVPQYLHLKDQFVASDPEAIATEAGNLLNKLDRLSVETLGEMPAAHFQTVRKNLSSIAEQKDLEAQRKAFVVLNENMVALTGNLDNLPSGLFILKCPMANNNKGALWISDNKEVRNPYYGAQMMHCGSVIDSLPRR